MKKAVAYLRDYMVKYENQFGYMDYSDETFIDDVLYGLGVALDEKQYSWANGFAKFKPRLTEHIKRNS